MSLASQAAAMAAFKATNKADQPSTKTFVIPKPPTHTRTKSAQKVPRITTTTASSVVSPSPRHQKTPSIYDVDSISLRSTTPAEDKGSDYFRLPKDSLYSPKAMKKSGSNHSNLSDSKAKAQDTINNLKLSLQQKSTAKDPSLKRISQEYAPQEMLNKLKQSINDRSKVNVADPSTKNVDMISEIRESIDLKRVHTPAIHDDDDLLNGEFNTSSYFNLPYTHLANHSSSTVSSRLSSTSTPPDIITTDVDAEQQNSPYSYDAPKHSNEYFQRPITPVISHGSAVLPVSPIMIPQSLSANAREVAAFGSNESLQLAIRNNKLQSSFDSAKMMSDDSSRSKPRRPPPDLHEGMGSFVSSSPVDVNRSRLLVDLESSYSENSATYDEKLPQYPNLNEKEAPKAASRRSIFKKKYKLSSIDLLTVDNDLLDPLATPSTGSRPSTPLVTHQGQMVHLKTTMRKEKKKKSFNEDKPWKNHTDLSYVSENERKRYESIWASNKGLYMNFVVHRLTGVDYDKPAEDNEKSMGDLDAPTRAAKLSSKQADDDVHNINHARPDGLILGPVVKRIWSRSKLPNETLEEIWDLVDYRKDGTLNKNEFVVGMWLVDQCLYGRKLPKKVDKVVWDSLENMGLNVVLKKRGKSK